MKGLSIEKIGEGFINEDAFIVCENMIAVSDGAGGGGVFADRWSKYLVDHLPDEAITDFETFDKWIDSIWENFYNYCEAKALKEGGMLLNKFYDEGSFATIVAVWKSGEWMSYGDSVAFCYNRNTGVLQHSFTKLSDFNNPPYLVNCKDPLNPEGFRSGKFKLEEDSVVFAASDAVAHYILMMYEVSRKEEFADELREAIDAQTKDSNFINAAMRMKRIDFEKDVIGKMLNCNQGNFKRYLQCRRHKGLIAHDDYSLVIM